MITRVLAVLGLVLLNVLLSPAGAAACGVRYQSGTPLPEEGCATTPSLVGTGTVAAAIAAATATRALVNLTKGAKAAMDATKALSAPAAGVSTPATVNVRTLPTLVNSYAQYLQPTTPTSVLQQAAGAAQAAAGAVTLAQAAVAAALHGDTTHALQAANATVTLLRSTAEAAATRAAQAAQAAGRSVHGAIGDPKNQKPRPAAEKAALDAAIRATNAADQVHRQLGIADRLIADLATTPSSAQATLLTAKLETAAATVATAMTEVADATTTATVLATHTQAGAQGVAVPDLGIDTYIAGDLATLQNAGIVGETVHIPGLVNPWDGVAREAVEQNLGGNLDQLTLRPGVFELKYRVFDTWETSTRTATSIKTIDWRVDTSKIATTGRQYLTDIINFRVNVPNDPFYWRGTYANTPDDLKLMPKDINHYVLTIAFPTGTPAQPLDPRILERYAEIARRAIVMDSGILVQLVPISNPDPISGHVTHGRNSLSHMRSHAQHIRTAARADGVDIPTGVGRPETQQAVRDYIQYVVDHPEQVGVGRYMSVDNAIWSRRGDLIIVRKPDGEWITALSVNRGRAAGGAPWNNPSPPAPES